MTSFPLYFIASTGDHGDSITELLAGPFISRGQAQYFREKQPRPEILAIIKTAPIQMDQD